MANLSISLEGIDQAIKGLAYKKNSKKHAVISAINDYYVSAKSVNDVVTIDTDTLIEKIWNLKETPSKIKTKRRNFSSLTSSINKDLKKLSDNGKNPDNIVITNSNIFDMSEEAKANLLNSFSDALKTGDVDIDQATSILTAITDFLDDFDTDEKDDKSADLISQIKKVLNKITDNVLPDEDLDADGAGGTDDEELEEIDDYDEDTEEIELDEDEEIEKIDDLDDIEEVDDIEVDDIDDDEIEEVELDEDEELEEIDDDIEEIELHEDEELEEIDDYDEDTEEIELDEDEEIEEIDDLDDIEEVDDIEVDDIDDDEIEEVELDEDEELEEIDDDIEEIELHEDEELEEIDDYDEDTEEIELDEDEEIEEIDDLDDIEEVDDIEVDDIDDDEIEEVELDEDEELEEIDDDIEDIELDEDEELEEIEDYDEGTEEIELDEDEEIEEIDDLDDIEEVDDIEVDDIDDDEIEEVELDDEELEEIDGIDDDIEEIELHEDEELEEIDDYDEDTEEIELDDDEELEQVDGLTEEELKALEEFKEKKKLAEQFDDKLAEADKKYNAYITVPAGEYTIGTKKTLKSSLELQKFDMPKVYIGKFPITNSLFESFVEETGYITTAEKAGFGNVFFGTYKKQGKKSEWKKNAGSNIIKKAFWYQPEGPESSIHGKKYHPVVQISVDDAFAFASWIGRRLPTETEWEAAARTDLGNKYPWGNHWKDNACNVDKNGAGGTTAVDYYSDYDNEFKISDLLGNIMEWISDMEKPPIKAKRKQKYNIAKGGGWNSKNDITISSRALFKPGFTSNTIGFRCISEIFK